MLINLEGVDLCGKTTLLDKFKLLFNNVEVIQRDKIKLPRTDNLEIRKRLRNYYLEELDKVEELLKEDPTKIIILDRFFISELVYGKIIRKYDSSDVKDLINKVKDKLLDISDKYGFGIIYLSDTTEHIWKRFEKDGDDYIKDKKYFHNLKGEYKIQLDKLTEFKQLRLNVFEDKDYRNQIIEKLLLSEFKYTRHG